MIKPQGRPVEFAGIAKSKIFHNEPWSLLAAFNEVNDQGERKLAFGTTIETLAVEELVQGPGNSGILYSLNSDEAMKGFAAIKQTEIDLRDGEVSIHALPFWSDVGQPGVPQLYLPKIR